MRLAEISSGVVVNVIEVDQDNIPDLAAGWPDAGEAGPGWVLENDQLIPPPLRPASVPESVSRFQARAALMQEGLLSAVEAVVAQADALTQMAWSDALEFRRDSPAIASLAAQVGLSSEQVDDLFRTAKSIAV